MLRFGTIGTGWITDEYIQGAKDSGLWELRAVCSRDQARAEAYAQKHGAPLAFDDPEKLADCPEIDAVYVASPNASHYEHCRLLLSCGKHVICEKPLCARAGELRELQALARQKGLVLLEAIMYMHLPQRRILEDALQKIGRITLAKIDFSQRSSKLDAYLAGELPNIFNPHLETGALMDLGVYCVTPALALFGPPERLSIEALPLKSGADGAGLICLRYPDKLIQLSYSKLGQAGANTDFQGTEGTVSVDSISRLAGIRLRRRDGSEEELWGSDEKFRLMGWEAKDFHRYITEPAASAEEIERCAELSLQVCEWMEAARKQAGIVFPRDQA